jgi:hypothetical protein
MGSRLRNDPPALESEGPQPSCLRQSVQAGGDHGIAGKTGSSPLAKDLSAMGRSLERVILDGSAVRLGVVW